MFLFGASNVPSLALTKAEGSKSVLDLSDFSDEEEFSLGLFSLGSLSLTFWAVLFPEVVVSLSCSILHFHSLWLK